MEKTNISQLKKRIFINKHILPNSKIDDSDDKIEESNYNKGRQIYVFKKSIRDKEKEQSNQYSSKTSRIYSRNYFLNKDFSHTLKNLLIKKKILLSKTPNSANRVSKSFKKKFTSPLKDKYRLLISNINNYNKRCFKNLGNKDLDNIFNYNLNMTNSPIKKNKKLILRSEMRRDNKSLETKSKHINEFNIHRSPRESKFINKRQCRCSLKNEDDIYKINTDNFNYDYLPINKNNNIQREPRYQSYLASNFQQFVFLLKKQKMKTMKLLDDVKRQEAINKDLIRVFVAKLNGYKAKNNSLY
jgi:hypothetical protein